MAAGKWSANPFKNAPEDGARVPGWVQTPDGEWHQAQRYSRMSTGRAFLIAVPLVIVTLVGITAIKKAASPVDVTYEVTGSAQQADITYQTPSGSSQQTAIDVPMVNKVTHIPGMTWTMHPGSYLYISAQNVSDSGSITCTIREGSKILNTNTSYGGATIATCSSRA